MGFDVGSFIGGAIVGGIVGMVFVGYNAIKVGANIFEQAGSQGWINKEEIERDLAKKSRMARAYHVRSTPRRPRRAFAAHDIYGHGSGTESDLNRIPIFL